MMGRYLSPRFRFWTLSFAELSPAKKVLAAEKVLEAEVRPALRRDGGDIELVDVEGTKIKVRFRGHCA